MEPRAKKNLGQHFLADPSYCRKIARFAGIGANSTVLEIGPGTGRLTKVLLELAQTVIAVEFDRDMVTYLQGRGFHQQQGRFTLIQADVLSLDWDVIVGDGSLKVIGNLPYNIATRIIQKMAEVKERFQDCTFLVQKEVASRILAGPGSKDYGYLSLIMDYHFQRIAGFELPPEVFSPRPAVRSQVLKLVPHAPPHAVPCYGVFTKLLKRAFQQRRKTIWNNLRQEYGPDRLRRGLAECGIDGKARPEQISFAQYACLCRML